LIKLYLISGGNIFSAVVEFCWFLKQSVSGKSTMMSESFFVITR